MLPCKRLTNEPYNTPHLHNHLQLLHLLTANITSQISKIQQRLAPLVVPVLHDIENLTGMTSDHSLFQGVLVDALDPGITVHTVDTDLSRIAEAGAQSPSGLCLQTDEVPVMTSTKMIGL